MELEMVTTHVAPVAQGGMTLVLVIIAMLLISASNRAKEREDGERKLRERMQGGLEATVAKLNPVITPPKKGETDDEDAPSEAFVALQKHIEENRDVVGASAAPPKKPRKPRKKKEPAPPIDPVQAEWEANESVRMSLAERYSQQRGDEEWRVS